METISFSNCFVELLLLYCEMTSKINFVVVSLKCLTGMSTTCESSEGSLESAALQPATRAGFQETVVKNGKCCAVRLVYDGMKSNCN
jgi:hypothetical protein